MHHAGGLSRILYCGPVVTKSFIRWARAPLGSPVVDHRATAHDAVEGDSMGESRDEEALLVAMVEFNAEHG